MKKASKITDLIETQIAISEDTISIIQEIIETITPFFSILSSPQNPCNQSFSLLMQISKEILKFETSFSKLESHSLLTISDLFNTFEISFQNLFENLAKNSLSSSDIQKLMKSKPHKPFFDTLTSKNIDLSFWFQFPYTYVKTWSIFWTRVLDIVTINDNLYSIYLQCRSSIQKIELSEQKSRVAEMFKSKLEQLFKSSAKHKVFIPKDSALLWCISGKIILKPAPVKVTLFIFEDRVAILRDDKEKTVFSSKLLNTWMVKSSMYPAKQNIIDILCTQQSFAFEPANEQESTALWKTWGSIATWCPQDWSIFQPVVIDPTEKESIQWEYVNK